MFSWHSQGNHVCALVKRQSRIILRASCSVISFQLGWNCSTPCVPNRTHRSCRGDGTFPENKSPINLFGNVVADINKRTISNIGIAVKYLLRIGIRIHWRWRLAPRRLLPSSPKFLPTFSGSFYYYNLCIL